VQGGNEFLVEGLGEGEGFCAVGVLFVEGEGVLDYGVGLEVLGSLVSRGWEDGFAGTGCDWATDGTDGGVCICICGWDRMGRGMILTDKTLETGFSPLVRGVPLDITSCSACGIGVCLSLLWRWGVLWRMIRMYGVDCWGLQLCGVLVVMQCVSKRLQSECEFVGMEEGGLGYRKLTVLYRVGSRQKV